MREVQEHRQTGKEKSLEYSPGRIRHPLVPRPSPPAWSPLGPEHQQHHAAAVQILPTLEGVWVFGLYKTVKVLHKKVFVTAECVSLTTHDPVRQHHAAGHRPPARCLARTRRAARVVARALGRASARSPAPVLHKPPKTNILVVAINRSVSTRLCNEQMLS